MKKWFLLLSFMMLFIAGCSSEQNEVNATTAISTLQSSADYPIPESIDELRSNAEHIVTVKAIQHVGQFLMDGDIFGTKTEVEVVSGHKGVLEKGEKIIVIEPAHVEKNEYIATESYLLMEPGEEYILFLRNGDDKNEYGIVSLGFGKYSENGKVAKAALTDFQQYEEVKGIDFISDVSSDVDLYEQIKKDVVSSF